MRYVHAFGESESMARYDWAVERRFLCGITQRLFARDSRRGGRDGAQNGGG